MSATRGRRHPRQAQLGTVMNLRDRKPVYEEFAIAATDLGRGNFSRIQKARHRSTKETFALKEIEKRRVKQLARRQPNITKEVLMERDLLTRLHHPGVIRLFHTFQNERCVYYLMEWIRGGELWHRMMCDRRPTVLSLPEARYFTRQVVHILRYLAAEGAVHRDVKPENLLVCGPEDPEHAVVGAGLAEPRSTGPPDAGATSSEDEEEEEGGGGGGEEEGDEEGRQERKRGGGGRGQGRVPPLPRAMEPVVSPELGRAARSTGRLVLVDFGTAKDLQRPAANGPDFVGTPEFMAPEVVRGGKGGRNRGGLGESAGSRVGPAADLWSLGCTVHQMLLGASPFRRESPFLAMRAVEEFEGKLEFPPFVPEDARDFILRLLQPDSIRRALFLPCMTEDGGGEVSSEEVEERTVEFAAGRFVVPDFDAILAHPFLRLDGEAGMGDVELGVMADAEYRSASAEARSREGWELWARLPRPPPCSLEVNSLTALVKELEGAAMQASRENRLTEAGWLPAEDYEHWHRRIRGMTSTMRARVLHFCGLRRLLRYPAIHQLFFRATEDERCLRIGMGWSDRHTLELPNRNPITLIALPAEQDATSVAGFSAGPDPEKDLGAEEAFRGSFRVAVMAGPVASRNNDGEIDLTHLEAAVAAIPRLKPLPRVVWICGPLIAGEKGTQLSEDDVRRIHRCLAGLPQGIQPVIGSRDVRRARESMMEDSGDHTPAPQSAFWCGGLRGVDADAAVVAVDRLERRWFLHALESIRVGARHGIVCLQGSEELVSAEVEREGWQVWWAGEQAVSPRASLLRRIGLSEPRFTVVPWPRGRPLPSEPVGFLRRRDARRLPPPHGEMGRHRDEPPSGSDTEEDEEEDQEREEEVEGRGGEGERVAGRRKWMSGGPTHRGVGFVALQPVWGAGGVPVAVFRVREEHVELTLRTLGQRDGIERD